MNGNSNEPIVYEFDYPMGPTTEGAEVPIGVNELVPHTERFVEMYNITAYRDGDDVARDIVLFNFTALHGKAGTRFKLAFWDRGVADVRKHTYRLRATVNFERGT